MKKRLLLLTTSFFYFSICFSQPVFIKQINTDDNSYYNKLIKTKDGNYVRVGTTTNQSAPYETIFIAKVDSNNNTIFYNIYTPDFQFFDYYISFNVVETETGDLIISGLCYYDYYTTCFLLFKINKLGEVIWSKKISFKKEEMQAGTVTDMIIASDKSILLVGTVKYFDRTGMFLSKFNSETGDLIYNDLITKNGNPFKSVINATSIIEITKDKYLVGGSSYEHDFYTSFDTAFIASFYRNGELLSLNHFSTPSGNAIYNLKKISGGNYIACGYSVDNTSRLFHSMIIKADTNNNILWSKLYPRRYKWNQHFEISDGLIEAGDGSLFVKGKFIDYDRDISYLMHLTNTGSVLWAKSYHGLTYNTYNFYNFNSDKDNSFILSGNLYNQNYERYFPHLSKINYDGVGCGIQNDVTLMPDTLVINVLKPDWVFQNIDSLSHSENFTLIPENPIYPEEVLCISTVLPFSLISFSAERKGKTNLLQWTTSNEINTKQFEIEKSYNGRIFEKQSMVIAEGNNLNKYIYTDAVPFKGMNYYRIKIIDKDGKLTYSPVKTINNAGSFDITLSPNPVATGKLNITVNAEAASKLQIGVYNSVGNLLYHKTLNVLSGLSYTQINTSSFSKGAYMLRINADKENRSIKFLVD